MNVSRFRLITFDLTGTLLNFRISIGKQYAEVGAMFGVRCDGDCLSANFKPHWHRMNQEHPNFGKNTLGWEAWWRQLVVGTFKDSTTNPDDKKLELIAAHLIKIYETSQCWQQSYGALDLLSHLRNLGIPLGIISNYDPRLDLTLTNTKLRHYFEFALGSYEIGMAKPDLEIFQKAMDVSKIPKLEPQQCLHVGNAALLDYRGAKNSNWNAVLVRDTSAKEVKEKYPFVDTNYFFPNLYHLHRHLLLENK